tara:strand:+ start:239 stop:1144 length:906 start_codon:yes stop_codon:yes gene_type:complete
MKYVWEDIKRNQMKIKILIPVYNDWKSLFKVIDEINNLDLNKEFKVSLIIINDASNHDLPNLEKDLKNIDSIKILNMIKNQGHTRSIAVGLKYIFEKEDFDYVIPMDGDGEDRPEEIKVFLDRVNNLQGETFVGERVKRSEKMIFKICYQLHKLITLIFTSKLIKFGNYTCLPKPTVEKLVNEKATWNSFSGSLAKVSQNLTPIPSHRGARYFGPSQMSFLNLIKHSLAIISVFRKTFLIRSALFIVIYIWIIKSNASIITSLPLLLLFIAVYSVSNLALRENMDEFKNSLNDIKNIDKIK